MATLRRRIVLDGHAVRLHESGAPAGRDQPTYLLVHGIGMSHRYLSHLHDALPPEARVVSIDLPGFAGLPAPDRDLDVSGMGSLLARVVLSLASDRVVLVGHSMGAQWAIEAARAVPDPVLAVVMIGPVVDDRHRTVGAQSRALAVDALGESPAVNDVVLSDYLRSGIRWYFMQLRHMMAYSTESGIRALRVPVLLMRGGNDSVAGEDWVRRLLTAARDATLVEIPGQQHNVQFSAPHDVSAAIERFVADIGQGGRRTDAVLRRSVRREGSTSTS